MKHFDPISSQGVFDYVMQGVRAGYVKLVQKPSIIHFTATYKNWSMSYEMYYEMFDYKIHGYDQVTWQEPRKKSKMKSR